MHLNATVDTLASNYGLKVTTHKPQVAYKETIRRAVHEHGRLKKQSGGHGQFADVKIDIAPRRARRGLRIHRQGRRRRGAAQLHSGGGRGGGGGGEEGAVRFPGGRYLGDAGGWRSSTRSTAPTWHSRPRRSLAMKEGLAKADPVLLEPIDHVTISVPNEFTPRAQRLLTGRRGQILGFCRDARAGRAGTTWRRWCRRPSCTT